MDDRSREILFLATHIPSSERVTQHLRDAGYRVYQADKPAEVMTVLMDQDVALVLLYAQAMTPFTERLVRQWRNDDPLLELVGLSVPKDHTEPELVRMDCRHVLKEPLELEKLDAALDDAFAQRAARAALVGNDETMARHLLQATLEMVRAVELKDAYTRGRADRVALFSGIIASEVPGADVELIRLAGRVHDVGKISIPRAILNKTDRLTDEEFDIVRSHPVRSWEMLRNLFDNETILGVARHHHERWDGQGYPDTLEGDAIPLEARIVTVADSLDALTSARAFRKALLWSDAVGEIVQGAGSRYDPAVISAFEKVEERLLLGR
ncbi:MAG: HD domain-containing protein [Gemmatimonadota bacterium]|jgi:HD-GYP domain-containing protein (c-di-GMP phosphodiesterase class II)